MAKVVRVYGKADNFDIELTRNGDIWEVDVPPDMTDGVYAVQLTAVDVNGDSAFWVGELFMVDGVCCMKIEPLPYGAYLKTNEYTCNFECERPVSIDTTEYSTQSFKKYDVHIIKTNKISRYTVEITRKTDVISFDSALSLQFCIDSADIKKRKDFDVMFAEQTEILFRKGCRHVSR